jgi:hypothetical protein
VFGVSWVESDDITKEVALMPDTGHM